MLQLRSTSGSSIALAVLLLLRLAAGVQASPSLRQNSVLSGAEQPLPFVNASGSVDTPGWNLTLVEQLPDYTWTWHVAVAAVKEPVSAPVGAPLGRFTRVNTTEDSAPAADRTILRQYWVDTSPSQDFQAPDLTWVGCAVFLQRWAKELNKQAATNRSDCTKLLSSDCQAAVQTSLGNMVLADQQPADNVCKVVEKWFTTQYPADCGGFGEVSISGLIGPGMSNNSDAGHGSLNHNTVLSQIVFPPDASETAAEFHKRYEATVTDSTMILTVLYPNQTLWQSFEQPKKEPIVGFTCLAPTTFSPGSIKPSLKMLEMTSGQSRLQPSLSALLLVLLVSLAFAS